MSPEDIFASQIWPWPDPALKRDTMGRVLFVNAAFLQMYGGTIEDWRGNVVTGWPAPQAPGTPYRFETRLPTAEGEQVYDWMEFTMADGTAFAMARNVTYLFQSPDPQPGFEAQPPVDQAPVEAQSAANAPQMPVAPIQPVYAEAAPEVAQTETAVQEPVPEPDPVMASDPVLTSDPVMASEPVLTHDPIIEAAQSVAPVTDVDVPEFEQALTEINEQPEMSPVDEGQPAQLHAPEVDIQDMQPQHEQADPQEETRDFERRALPIENQDAVLGNNWRDAVIAKAVGAESNEAEEAPAAEDTQTAPSADGQIRILLAEDNAINALLTRTLLEAEGHAVDTVEDGVLAVEAMKTSSYDLIFMDMRMPNMDGLEATRKIRALSNVPKGLPIVALTANAFDDDRNACFDSGMNDFMTKPVSAEELSEMVRTWTKNLAERNAA